MKTFNYTFQNNNLSQLIDFSIFENKKNILVQIFCGHKSTALQLIINHISNNIPQALCIGTTTDGEIKDETISILTSVISITIFEHTFLKASYKKGSNSFDNGFELAKQLVTNNTKLLILFTDGTTTNGEEFLKGVESYDNKIVICGGMAGDNGEFTQTYISCGQELLKSGAVGVSLNSDILQVYNDYRFNWSPIGIEHTIDKIKDNRVYEISGMTPVDFYAKYLGDDVALALPATGIEFPLIIQKNAIPTARAVIAKHKDGSLSFAGNLQQGDKVKLGFGNAEMILQNPIESLENIKENEIQSIFIYSCMARRRYMPNFIGVEIEPFASLATTAGFFTYAEFYHNEGSNDLLNQTLTYVALSENRHNAPKTKVKLQKHSTTEYGRTIKALTHLIQQSTNDYEKQTKKLNKEKNYSHNLMTSQKQFLRHTVHETNTPLSVIMGNIELYEMEHGKNKYLCNIEVAMKNVFSIYDDLSYMVKKDQITYNKHQIDLVDYVRSRIDFFTQVANQVNADFIFEPASSSMPILFNDTKLQRIIDNNLTNAIKYTFENENILISLTKENQNYKLMISTHSSIIQHPKKVFEEYYREENTQEGFGLGLNLVKRICEEEDVEIILESNKYLTSFTYIFKGI